MTWLKKPPPNNYKCDKCGCFGSGGDNPTMFDFDQIEGEYDLSLCASCYKDYWVSHNKFCYEWLNEKIR